MSDTQDAERTRIIKRLARDIRYAKMLDRCEAGQTMAKRALFVTSMMVALFVALAIVPDIFKAAAQGKDSRGILGVSLLLLEIAYIVLLFFAAPPCMMLRFLRVRERWAYLVSGVLSNWLFLFVYIVNSDWSLLAKVHTIDLFWPSLFGLLFGWFWSMSYIRLPGDNSRDWQTRVQPNNPVDLI